jgi:thymidylate synthase ThyX
MSNQISATVICDSINEHNDRITTIECVVPRIVLAEFNTHRMFSRNSASSRAIPAKKMIQMLRDEPFIPIKWMKQHSGMQGNEYFDLDQPEVLGQFRPKYFPEAWLRSRDTMINMSESMADAGLTKQITNRLLEPFMYHKILVTATDYENFTSLRANEAAEIHIQDFAYKLIEALNKSVPKSLRAGEWHMPYSDGIDSAALWKFFIEGKSNVALQENVWARIRTELKLKICTARCAQTSYVIIGEDGKPMDYEKLIKLHDRLAENGHVSPFEHCSQAMTKDEYFSYARGKAYWVENETTYEGYNRFAAEDYGWCGNFRGWKQYRKMLPNENRTDSRIIKHTYNG